MFDSFIKVFRHLRYVVTTAIVAFIVFSLSVLLSNFELIKQMFDAAVPFGFKLKFVFSLLGTIGTNYTGLGAITTILVALLFGVNIALFAYYLSHSRKVSRKGEALGIVGLILGVIGTGCFACGSFLLASVIGLTATASFVTFWPLHGQEIGILGVVLLGLSIYFLLKQISKPNICTIEEHIGHPVKKRL